MCFVLCVVFGCVCVCVCVLRGWLLCVVCCVLCCVLRGAHKGINKGLQDGSLKPYAGPTFKLAEAPASHVEVIEHKLGTKGKIILTVRDQSGKTEL